LARDAAPVYAHLHLGNSRSIGIEVAHSGRSADSFPEDQARSVAWLLGTLLEMSGKRLKASDVYGHKDLDRRPAYVSPHCERPACPVFTDADGRAYRRRVDPPGGLFAALVREGLVLPRAGREDDRELHRAEALGASRARVKAR
jgi:N-acetyl-anhydromuramyl-L-alanine amidase AmpD